MKKDFRLSSIKVGGLLLGFVLQLYFTRIIGLKEYGTYILFSTWINVFSLVLILGFDKVVIKQVSYFFLQNEKGKFRYTVDKLIKFVLLNCAIFLIFAFLVPQDLLTKTFFSDDLHRSTWLFISIGAVVFAIFTLLGKILSATQRVELAFLRSEVLYKAVWLIVVIILVAYFRSVAGINIIAIGALVAYVFTILLFFLLIDRKRIMRYVSTRAEPVALGKENFIFFFLTFNYYITAQIDKILLGKFATREALGIYGLVTTLCLMTGFSTIIYQGFLPKISTYMNSNRLDDLVAEFKVVVRNALILALPALAFIIVFAEDVLRFFGESYVQGAIILRILILGQMFDYYTGPIGPLLNNGKYSKIDFINSLVGVMLTIGLGYFGYKTYGIIGLAIVTSIGTMIINIVKVIEVKILYKIFPYQIQNLFLTILVIIVFYAVRLMHLQFDNQVLQLACNFLLGVTGSLFFIIMVMRMMGKNVRQFWKLETSHA